MLTIAGLNAGQHLAAHAAESVTFFNTTPA